MKKYLIVAFLILTVSGAFAQLGGFGKTTVVKVTGLQDSLNLKLNVADVVDPIATGLIYSADSVDILTNREQLLSTFKMMKGWCGWDLLPVGSEPASTNTLTLTDNRHHLATFVAKETKTYVSASIYVSTAFVGTADGENGIALYSVGTNVDPNNADLIANSKVVAADAFTATGMKVFTFAAPITLTKGKEYKIGLLYNSSAQTTAPIILRLGYSLGGRELFSNANWTTARYNGINTFPATLALASSAAETVVLGIGLNE